MPTATPSRPSLFPRVSKPTPTKPSVDPTALLIDRGDLASMVALALEAQSERVVVWMPFDDGPASGARAEAIARHARVYAAHDVIDGPLLTATTTARHPAVAGGLELLYAIDAALQRGIARVIWPVTAMTASDPASGAPSDDASTNAIAEAINRATLASMVVAVNGGPEVVVETPVVDLDGRRLADLADDLGAPMNGFWPCEGAGETPCGSCAGCRASRAGFQAAGLPWPWPLPEAVEEAAADA